jgi:predicted nuclease of restriction endonuclease-like (RecB) superfamily
LEKLKEPDLRLWYAEQTITNGWSKNILAVQIETKLHKRIGQTANNFEVALPPDDSDMANQIFNDPYLFDFLGTAEVRKEAELENKLIEHLEKFLLELGQGFAFVGRQVHMEVGGDDFYIDLLFYHLKLRCYVVVELKAGKFCPGHVSQLTMYMNIVDDMLCHPRKDLEPLRVIFEGAGIPWSTSGWICHGYQKNTSSEICIKFKSDQSFFHIEFGMFFIIIL